MGRVTDLVKGFAVASLATILLGSQGHAQELPAEWGTPDLGARVTVEVEAETLPDRVRYTYTVRNVDGSSTRGWPAVDSLLIGAPADSVRSELTAEPIAVESPPGWEARLYADDRSSPRTWRLQWSCRQAGWDHALRYQIKAGRMLSGFRVTVGPDETAYPKATYAVGVNGDHGIPVGGALGQSGRVIVKKARPSK